MHKTKRKASAVKVIILAAILAIFYAGYGFVKTKILPKFTGQNNQQSSAQAMGMRVAEVNAVIIHTKKVEKVQELPARVTAYKISEVRPQVTGVIEKQLFTEGSLVKKGQSLYQIDTSLYQAAYDDALANYKTLAAKKKRYDAIVATGAISNQEYDDVVASYQTAKASAKKAATNLQYANIPAPISGHVGKTNVTVGSLATANQTEVLTTITQLDPIYVDIVQPSKELLRLGQQKGAKISLKIDGISHEEHGVLEFAEMFADSETDSVRLRSKFSNKHEKLLPGMFVTATIHLKPFDAITVPQKAATRTADGNLMVWVIEEGDIAKPRIIKAEQTFNDEWVVIDGLKEGEVVITEGYLKIADGAKVKATITNAEENVVKTLEPQQQIAPAETTRMIENKATNKAVATTEKEIISEEKTSGKEKEELDQISKEAELENKLLDPQTKKPEAKSVNKNNKKSSAKSKKNAKKTVKKKTAKKNKN